MERARPWLLPDPSVDREEMVCVQRRVRAHARFDDEEHAAIRPDEHTVIAGVDQAFDGEEAISAVVAMRDGEVIEEAHARSSLAFPYIPGLLAFREAGPILQAVCKLSTTPDILLCDGNGRIHPREAGLATHVGVALDLPTVGVAKRLLCGRLQDPPDAPYPVDTRVAVVADEGVEAADGTVLGYAVQTRQWAANRTPAINPVYVSPGHRVSAETATAIALASCAGYKLPEPIRRADRLAGERAA